ncbi:MAG TPA: pilus assembly protein, partial [Candidatus Goldiibacteriota bacterium]|nr:pilus assembly protein [Candidatus Goldiibacteriota bacterium]
KFMLKSRKAQGMTEYILIIALVAIMIIASLKFFGGRVKKGFNDASDKISQSMDSGNKGAEDKDYLGDR